MRHAWPLVLLVACVALAYAFGLQRTLSFGWLSAHLQGLRSFVAAHPFASVACYVAIYAATVTVAMPGDSLLTMAGGLLFGVALGAPSTVAGATIGAVLLFLVARSSVGSWLAHRAGPLLDRIRPGLERDGFSYLLALRLLPVFPFWLVNLGAALVGMELRSYALATLIGIVPACVVYSSIGAGLGGVLAEGGQPNLAGLLRPAVLLPFVGLALLALTPVAVRRWRAAHG